MLCAAVKVSLLVAQLTASLTLMSPEPEEVEPWDEKIVTLPVPSALESVFPEISPEGVPPVTVPVLSEAIVKSFGSINQLPVLPEGAAVVILHAVTPAEFQIIGILGLKVILLDH